MWGCNVLESIISPKFARLMPGDVLARVQRLLVVAYTLTELDVEDERDLADAIAQILDDAISYRAVPAPYGAILEATDRSVLRIMARQAGRAFRRKWGKLNEAQRKELLDALMQAKGDL
jgi:hypothetical protein